MTMPIPTRMMAMMDLVFIIDERPVCTCRYFLPWGFTRSGVFSLPTKTPALVQNRGGRCLWGCFQQPQGPQTQHVHVPQSQVPQSQQSQALPALTSGADAAIRAMAIRNIDFIIFSLV